jgi:hypothetical protein
MPELGNPRCIAWCNRYKSLKDYRATTFDPEWQEIADYIMPRKGGINRKQYNPKNAGEVFIFNTAAEHAITVAAAGLTSWTTPAYEPWFKFAPIRQLRNVDTVERWMQECTQLMQEYLSNSNFYTEIHEDNITHLTFCTSAMFSQLDEKGSFAFESFRVGSYVIEENHLGQVDTLMREFELSARQAAQKFGDENLSPNTRKLLAGDGKQQDQKVKFLHVVEPRTDAQRIGRAVAERKAFLSCYIEMESQHLVQEGGFDSFPFHVGRYEKCDFLEWRSPYGYGPGFKMLPEARQLNFLDKMLDVTAEKQTFPPLMVPDSFEGELMTSARALNYYPPGMADDRIYPLQTTLDIRATVERAQLRENRMTAKTHLDMWQMMANLEGIRTATEIQQRAAEKIDTITPAYTRLTSEKIGPMMVRLFELAAENGMLPPPPDEAVIKLSEFMVQVPNPTVQYTSRLALAINAVRMVGMDRMIERLAPIASIKPEVLDPIDFDVYVTELARNSGAPTNFTLPPDQVAAIRQQRAQAQQAMMQVQMAEQGANAISKLAPVMGNA